MPEPPVITIFAGPNGSGKSTLTRQIEARSYALGTYINADDIASALFAAAHERGEQASRSDFEVAAFWEAERLRQECVNRPEDFAFVTVSSHPSKLDLIARAKAAGFIVKLYFVSTENPMLNVARVRQRVAEGGHSVPEDKVITRYRRTMSHLPAACLLVDEAVLFDNSGLSMRAVAQISWSGEQAYVRLVRPLASWIGAWVSEITPLIAGRRGRQTQ
jgi:predicted ABC-type ATPase